MAVNNETTTLSFETPAQTQAFAKELATQLRPGDVLVLVGELGAGKTTLTQGLGQGLGVRGQVASPTFIISRIHKSTVNGPDLVHVDAYRLNELTDLETLDLESEIANAIVVIEWGKGLVEELFPERLEISITRPEGFAEQDFDDFLADPNGGTRELTLRGFGERWDGLADFTAVYAQSNK